VNRPAPTDGATPAADGADAVADGFGTVTDRAARAAGGAAAWTAGGPPDVVKLGGSLLEDPALRNDALDAIAARRRLGAPMVLVHGGGKKVDATLAAMGIARRTHAGLRVTDGPTLEVVTGVLPGIVGKGLVADLRARGVRAAGVSGVDGGTLVADPHPPVGGVELGFVGTVTASAPALVEAILAAGFLPVVAPLAAGRDGGLLNVNADAAAAALAVALGAARLIFLTDVEGLRDASGTVVPRLGRGDAARLLASDVVRDGMRPKLAACLDALAGGVGEVLIAGPDRHAAALAGGAGGTHLVAA
jgi:acetylglutamate kinase